MLATPPAIYQPATPAICHGVERVESWKLTSSNPTGFQWVARGHFRIEVLCSIRIAFDRVKLQYGEPTGPPYDVDYTWITEDTSTVHEARFKAGHKFSIDTQADCNVPGRWRLSLFGSKGYLKDGSFIMSDLHFYPNREVGKGLYCATIVKEAS